jgi:prepilin-type N-terminal cleavage/methylation domain-containing protein
MSNDNHRRGVTLIEVIVAMLLFSTGALGLAAASAVITRQMTLNVLRSRSAGLARERSERAMSSPCGSLAAGDESRDGIRATWTVTSGASASIHQQLERSAVASMQIDHFFSAVPCE